MTHPRARVRATVDEPAPRVRVGVAGWDYPDWQGIVYPVPARRGLDRLAYLAGFVDLIEINSTFYRPALPRVAAGWVRRTAALPEFAFSAKAHRSCTHEPDADPGPGLAATLDGLAPIREAGRLAALLLQFPQSFHDSAASRERLARLAERMQGWPVCVEVRHRSWGTDEAARWFEGRSLGWCAVDQPRVGSSTLGLRTRTTARVAYLRLHGRNTADWFRRDAGRDARYDYLYAESELHEIRDSVQALARGAEEVVVVTNNHFRGQALVNALQLKHLLERTPPSAPAELVAAYPSLRAVVRAPRDRLF